MKKKDTASFCIETLFVDLAYSNPEHKKNQLECSKYSRHY